MAQEGSTAANEMSSDQLTRLQPPAEKVRLRNNGFPVEIWISFTPSSGIRQNPLIDQSRCNLYQGLRRDLIREES